MKQTIRLNEADLHRIVKESVNKIIKEEQLPPISIHDNDVDEEQMMAVLNHVNEKVNQIKEELSNLQMGVIRILKDGAY